MSKFIKCPNCKSKNQVGAQFCKGCGQPLGPQPKSSSGEGEGRVGLVDKMLNVTDDFLDVFAAAFRPQKPEPTSKKSHAATGAHQAVTVRAPQKIQPKQPGGTISYYQILETLALGRSNYYKVYCYRCESCKHENPNNTELKCTHCKQPLRRYVLRESFAYAVLDEVQRHQIKDLSERVPGVLKHNLIFYLGNIQYILLDGFPDPWFSLAQENVLPARDYEKVVAWLSQLGNALKHLHQQRYSFYDENQLPDWVEPVLVLKNQQAYLADITSCTQIQNGAANPLQKDIFYLAKVLYTMVTGDRQNVSRNTGRLLEVPGSFREVIKQAQSGGFATIDAFLNAVQGMPREAEVVRSLRQLVGYGTDIGKQRDHNEDYVSKFSLGLEQIPGTPEIGLYIVADGMGGHQAGEKASESVIKDVVINRIQEQLQKLQSVPKLKRATVRLDDVLTPGEILREAMHPLGPIVVLPLRLL
jgi:hypothetical protein